MTASITDKPRSAWASVTPLLIFSCFCLLVGDLLFGYDTASFGGILANPGFLRQFGSYDAEADNYGMTPTRISLMSSLAFIGKFIGCFIAGPLIERYGHRVVFWILSAVSIIGVVIEITAADSGIGTGRYAQFVIGRIVVYISVGLVEVGVTTYQSEIVPAAFRGIVVISLQLFLNAGATLAVGINKAFSTYTSAVGWKVVTAIQFLFPVCIAIFTIFIPSSPRWLLSKDRAEEAIDSLRRLRPKSHSEDGTNEAEMNAIRDALQEHVHKGSWIDLVRGSNLRRTMLVFVFYFYQQTTGQAFVSTYQTIFYRDNGYAAQAFTYPVILNCLNTLIVLPAMYLTDKMGRRSLLLLSYALQAFFIMNLAGIGSMTDKSAAEKNYVVAAFMLFSITYNLGGASIPYLLGTELPNASIREKTQSIGAAWNVIWAFVTNYVLPYMIEDLKFKTGWVFGGISLSALVFTFFFLPETKGLALEDIDSVFAHPFNPFRRQTKPVLHPERALTTSSTADLPDEKQRMDACLENQN